MSAALISLPDNPFGDSRAFQVRRYGIAEGMPPSIVGPASHPHVDDYLCIHFAGPFEFEATYGRVVVPGPAVVVWPPGSPRTYGHREGPWNHSWLHVSGSRVGTLLRRHSMSLLSPIGSPAINRTEKVFRLLHEECVMEEVPCSEVLQNLFVYWLLGLRRAPSPRFSTVPPGVIRARQLIESQLTSSPPICALAKEAGMSVSQFYLQFKRTFGVTPGNFQQQCKMERARHLLSVRKMRVAEVAEALGYADAFVFSKAFRRAVGVCPSFFRRDFRGRL